MGIEFPVLELLSIKNIGVVIVCLLLFSSVCILEAKAENNFTLEPIADSYVSSAEGEENSNFGGKGSIEISMSENIFTGIKIGYVMFDLSQFPDDTIIEEARFLLHCWMITETHKIGLHYCEDNTWSEYEINWFNKPDFNKTGYVVTVAKEGTWYAWKATEYVQKVLSNPDKKLTLVVISHSKHETAWVMFYSRDQEYSWMEKYAPKLEIKYSGVEEIPEDKKPEVETKPEENDDFCFIATAAYGSPTAEKLDILRDFRDKVLEKSNIGRMLVNLYYEVSPPIADFISQHYVLRVLVRVVVVDPIVKILEISQSIWNHA